MPSSFSTSTSILSPAPISPFSPRTLSSSASHYTSDDLPDLGAFNTVLREWVHLQPYPRIPSHHRPDYQHLLHSDLEEEGNLNDSGTEDRDTTGARSTVWNQRLIADYLHSGLSQITRTTSGESDSESATSQSSDLGEDEEEDEEDGPEDEPDDEELEVAEEDKQNEEDEDDDTEGARTVEIADDDDDIAGEERDHDNTHLASVGSTTSPLRTQPSLHGDDDDDDDREQDDDPGHEVPISHIGVGEDIDIDTDIDIDIGTNADTDASPSLGYLDEALSFIAAERERARWSALHGYSIGIGGGLREEEEEEGEWMHVIEHAPRRKKRRGRKRPVPVVGEGLSIASDNFLNYSRVEGDDAEEEEEAHKYPRSKSTEQKLSKSTPETPAPKLPQSRSRRPKASLLNHVYAPAYDSATTATTTTATATTSATTSTVVVEPASPSTSKSSSTLKSTPRTKSKTTVTSLPNTSTSLPTAPESKSLSSKSRSSSTKSKLKLKSTATSRPKLKITTQDDVTAIRTGTGPGKGSIFPYKILTRSRSTPTLPSPAVGGDSAHRDEDGHIRVPSKSETDGTKRVLRRSRSRSRSPLPSTSNGRRLPTHDTEKGGERVRLSRLVHVLKGVFPEDSVRLGEVEGKLRVQAAGGVAEGELLDVRGRDPVPRVEGGMAGRDPLIHVFVDHSNILVGLLTYLKRHPRTTHKAKENEGKESKVLKPRPPKPRPPSTSLGDPPPSPGISVVEDNSPQHDGDVDRDTITRDGDSSAGRGEYDRAGYPSSSIPGKRTASKDPKQPTLTIVVKGALPTLGEKNRSRPSSLGFGSAGESPTSPATNPASATQALKARLGAGIGMTPIPLPSFATAGKALRNRSGSGVTSPSQPHGDGGAALVRASSITLSLAKSPTKPKGSYLSRSSSLGHRSPGAFISESASTSNSGATLATDNPNATIWSGDVRDRDRDRNGNEDGNDGDGLTSVYEKKIKMMRGGRNGEVGQDGGDDDIEQEQYDEDEDDEDWEGDGEGERKTKKQARRLSHTALALILERGRPITRRVLVTSSPLYQPMDTMKRLGYEVRVYMRVPDLGDGMDRERYHHKHKDSAGTTTSGSGGSPKKLKTHARRISGNTSAESASAGASTSTSAGEAATKAARRTLRASFTSPESSSIPAPIHASAHSHSYSYAAAHSVDHNVPGPGGLGRRIRYREQGVDELLQLKLHQALAATDDVPEGATIVLATGDGNVGQFSEDGFLGPVRTALRRGWKVELYAWEEGLSRAWRREFGDGSEWGRSGMFRIVGMEQFAQSLVEGGL